MTTTNKPITLKNLTRRLLDTFNPERRFVYQRANKEPQNSFRRQLWSDEDTANCRHFVTNDTHQPQRTILSWDGMEERNDVTASGIQEIVTRLNESISALSREGRLFGSPAQRDDCVTTTSERFWVSEPIPVEISSNEAQGGSVLSPEMQRLLENAFAGYIEAVRNSGWSAGFTTQRNLHPFSYSLDSIPASGASPITCPYPSGQGGRPGVDFVPRHESEDSHKECYQGYTEEELAEWRSNPLLVKDFTKYVASAYRTEHIFCTYTLYPEHAYIFCECGKILQLSDHACQGLIHYGHTCHCGKLYTKLPVYDIIEEGDV